MAHSFMKRRAFLSAAAALAAAALAAGCRSTGGGASADEAIGPLMPAAALAARIGDVKTGKIAVLYVGPDSLFDRGHVPGAREIGALPAAIVPPYERDTLDRDETLVIGGWLSGAWNASGAWNVGPAVRSALAATHPLLARVDARA